MIHRPIHNRWLSFCILGLTISICSISHGQDQIKINDLKPASANQYEIVGNDPYIIFDAQQTKTEPDYLILNLGKDLKGVPLELFFNSENDIFDPYYKLSFTAPEFPSALRIPKEVNLDNTTRLRLDITECDGCLIEFISRPVLESESNDMEIVEATHTQNGIKRLIDSEPEILLEGWRMNDLNGKVSNFTVSGGDPYLVSPRLSTSTENLAAVYFKLKAPNSGSSWNHYQLYYQTERHPFIAQARSAFQMADNTEEIVEFVVPLDYLSTEFPPSLIVERLRLDLPEISGAWSLLEVKLLHQDQYDEFKPLVPKQIFHTKQQRATGYGLINKVLNNLFSDLSFFLSYLLLIIVTAYFFFRAYRSNS